MNSAPVLKDVDGKELQIILAIRDAKSLYIDLQGYASKASALAGCNSRQTCIKLLSFLLLSVTGTNGPMTSRCLN